MNKTARDLPSLSAAEVLACLQKKGYALLKGPVAEQGFERLSRDLGEIILKTDIRIDRERIREQNRRRIRGNRPSTYQAEALDFHMDNPNADLLAWHCLRQEPGHGALYLIDTADLAARFDEQTLAVMQTIEVAYSSMPGPGQPERLLLRPLLKKHGQGYQVYYQSWLLQEAYSDRQTVVLQAFTDYLAELKRTARRDIALQPGDCLFIDNHRLLHGRGALPPDSPRHLVRYFIRLHPHWRSS